ncbi:organelle RRM domain-containing protein 2, mitochondrial-like, partial [Magnolia sinica]|uniref:organelle RRM domain-containing protein 2, mitochondrial-like n=1 Tax=Magnolia sinica TaxID=86752 RepID=UPI002659BD06
RVFSTCPFSSPSPAATPQPAAEPSTNLFVSGLSKRTTSEGLREAFSKFGQVVHARVVTDRVSGYSKGFSFVRYDTLEDAAEGIKGMDGKFLDGWVIFAEYARPRLPPPPQTNGPSPSGFP